MMNHDELTIHIYELRPDQENINVSSGISLIKALAVRPSAIGSMVLLPWEPFEDPAISWEKIHGQV